MEGRPVRRGWMLVGLLGIVSWPIVSAAQTIAIAPDRQKTVLSLSSVRWDSAAATPSDAVLEDLLSDGLAGQLDYYPEYMDLARFPEPGYQEAVRNFLHSKYSGRRFDLIISNGDAALDFVARHPDDVLFAGTPVVFSAAARSGVLANATGVIAPLNFRNALESAIGIQPDTTGVVVVSGASAFDKYYERVARDQFKSLEGRLAFTYLTGLPVVDLLRAVAVVPAHSIVFYTSVSEDGAGQKFVAAELLERLSAASSAPAYAWIDLTMGHGIVGGRLVSTDVLLKRTAELALRVLAGENPETIPVTGIDWGVTQFDWRQLQRWDISEARLPAGSRILYREPRAWERYRTYIIGGVLLVMVQTGLIAVLLVQRKRRTRMQQALRESEERFRLMADTTPVLIWRAAPDRGCDFCNKPWLEFTGRTLEQELGDGWSEGVFPDDRDHCLRTYLSAFDARQPFRMEYRLRRRDGVFRWLLASGVPRYGAEGAFAGYIGSCIDITERRDAEESLQDSQKRYSMATTAGSVGVWELNFETNDIYVDPKLKSILGFEDGEIANRLRDWSARVHPDDAAALTARVQECLNGEADTYEVEHRMLHKDGSVRWFLSRGSVVRRADGTPGSLIGTDVDVTERKAAERERGDLTAQLQHLAGQLIVAQETERARIARDLHDDVSQQLAGLAIALSSLKRRVGTLPADDNLRNDVSSLQRRTIAVSENVRHLSHDLHSSVLQHAGLVAGLTAHCDDIRRYENLEVSFSAIGDFESADADAALCLYRVAQEALRNIVKHADARRADVRIRRVADDAELTVSDDGKGFDVAETRKGRKGLGLISINERARLAGGTVTIATELNGGTRVQIRIPVVPSLVLSQTPRP